jgi:excisionase family DNA binding protein
MSDCGRRPPLTIHQASQRLNTSEHSVRQAILSGQVDAFKIGGRWRILPESLDKLMTGGRDGEAAR